MAHLKVRPFTSDKYSDRGALPHGRSHHQSNYREPAVHRDR